MFFMFTEYDDGNTIPVFEFLGTYSIDVLPSILNPPGSKDSGLTEGLAVDREQISIYIVESAVLLHEKRYDCNAGKAGTLLP
jgi:hypothetical protein